ncbi:MAG: chromosome segregation SMC family protein [Gammaproteobacteria bacterium]|nr:MAG: chromosome segregation protein SMC [Gammaproteobacteria bacterium]
MRLKNISLSGFKSFVDPTKIPFPSSMSGVVGPNGCGKSNIIDAVRWVMGEISAKNLRGESMADVIFSGSSSRAPSSRASVELLFDNSLGKLGGEYSSYSEISVRRVLEIDGRSIYYLNGSECRRKDITDIFLGTGLGPRSYAVIEQEMATKLISSKPEELRMYIEEVAGISVYRERKKETESRIKKTKENLSRVKDLKDEIERQLLKLKRQVKSAERYKSLKEEEKNKKGLLKALSWQKRKEKISKINLTIKESESNLEKERTLKISLGAEIDKSKVNQSEIQQKIDKVQQDYYSSGADLTNSEQELALLKEKKKDLLLEKDQIEENLKSFFVEKESLVEQQSKLEIELSHKEPELQALDESFAQLEGAMSPDFLVEKLYLDVSNLTISLEEVVSDYASKNVTDISVIHNFSIEIKKKLEKLKESLKHQSQYQEEKFKAQKIELLALSSEITSFKVSIAEIKSKLGALEKTKSDSETNRTSIENKLINLEAPIQKIEAEIKPLLDSRIDVEGNLSNLREEFNNLNELIRNNERKIHQTDLSLESFNGEIQKSKLERQGLISESAIFEEQLKNDNYEIQSLLDSLRDDLTEDMLIDEISRIESSIERIGPINLAAAEEYKLEEERNSEIDVQLIELNSALETLQSAIKKIDLESRTKFKDTLDKLNIKLAELFPKLFGGGFAKLELTESDLLESGVLFKAMPPGKKNVNVSQLSGGEKALSSIALVFSFFSLNPAPFCILDEIDAPLDDFNTSRFINMVEEMSEKVQFIFVTHNKISMEKSKHLMGVTMQEPGVSRLVSVDVDEALKMAAS